MSGYHGQPMLKPPVWTWEVPLYFWIGGAAGMSAAIALGSLAGDGSLELTRAAIWLAGIGALVSPVLLILDLGRPRRFLHMLRVFKPRSPMSVGVWTLVVFGNASGAAFVLFEGFSFLQNDVGLPKELLSGTLFTAMLLSGLSGALLATYTGVLLGATAIPAWSSHAKLLPAHFATASLGTGAALLEIFGPHSGAIELVGLVACSVETLLFVVLEASRRGAVDRVLREGKAGRRLRIAAVLMGPLPLICRMAGASFLPAALFALGALVSRFAWVAAGRASAADPDAALAAQAA